MSIREALIDYSKGDNLRLYWQLFRWRERTRRKFSQDVLTFFLNRMAHHHGGYIGNGAVFRGNPVLPHGLHGVFISRYARIGSDCWIYQNVTIGAGSSAADAMHQRRKWDRPSHGHDPPGQVWPSVRPGRRLCCVGTPRRGSLSYDGPRKWRGVLQI